MEFDEKAGRPTFRVRAGASGRSRALAVAEKAGLPARVLASAKKRLGEKWEAADAALTRLETETRRAREEADKAKAAAEKTAARLLDLERERAALAAERAKVKEKAKEQVDKALATLREKTRQELERMREDLKAGRGVSRGALMTVTQSAREAALGLFGGDDEPPPLAGPVSVGMEVRIAGLGATGRLLALAAGRGEADVEVKGKRVRVSLAALSPASSVPLSGRAIPIKTLAPASSRPQTSPPSSSGVVATMATVEVVLVGQRVDDALPVVEKAINDALLSGKAALRLVHGHGTGRLAAAVREFLKTHPGIASYRWGDAEEGGQAVTIARLDV
jgi:DNA mismatch repair protein MutS2